MSRALYNEKWRESDSEKAVLHQLEASCQEQEGPRYRKSHSATLNDTLAKVCDKELSNDCTLDKELSMMCTKGMKGSMRHMIR